MADVDEKFYDRADAVIALANQQTASIGRGKVSASCMYATARFNAWVTACSAHSSDELRAVKSEAIDYFVREYRIMLEENLDDYINNFDVYMKPPKK